MKKVDNRNESKEIIILQRKQIFNIIVVNTRNKENKREEDLQNYKDNKENHNNSKKINLKYRINKKQNNINIKNVFISLLIFFYSIEFIFSQTIEKLRKINLISEIIITIRGKGDQYILNNKKTHGATFKNIPSEIYINGILQEYQGKIVYNLENEENTIKMKFNYTLKNCNVMFYNLHNITKIDLSNFDSSKVTTMYKMFQSCTSLTSINLDNLDTSSVLTMEDIFAECFSLKFLYLNNFNTSSVENMNQMFYNCKLLTSLNLNNFDTSSVTTMSGMFYGCNLLISLNLSNFNTSSVINMRKMFQGCKSLKTLDISNFNTSSATNMDRMFASCNSLLSLDLNSFNILNVTNMDFMFFECCSLTSLDLNNFQTWSVKNMSNMFSGCQTLKSLDLKNFNTSNVNSMNQMFKNCTSLISLNIDNFDTSLVNNMNEMFSDCISLISLNLNNFDTKSITNITGIVNNCSSNLIYCINETKTPNLIFEIKSSYPNYINNCSNICFDKKIKFAELKNCLYNCLDDDIFKYEYNENMCYKHCPNGTHNSYKNNKYICEENENCNLIDYNDICNVKNDNINELNDMIIDIRNELINGSLNILIQDTIYQNKTDLIIKTNDCLYQLTSSENQNKNEYINISTIILDECENILKSHYNINESLSLIIFKVEYYEEGALTPKIEYEIYHPLTKEKLDLTLCNNTKIDILIPVSINEDELFKYNLSSEYYNDICYTYTTDKNTDIILNDRKNEYYNNNLSLCEENCEYENYDYENKKVSCKCEIKIKLLFFSEISFNKDKLFNNFINLKNEINIFIMKCFSLLFSKEGLLKQYWKLYIIINNIIKYNISYYI